MTICENPPDTELLILSPDGSNGVLLGLSTAIICSRRHCALQFRRCRMFLLASHPDGSMGKPQLNTFFSTGGEVEFESNPAGLTVSLHFKLSAGGFEFDLFSETLRISRREDAWHFTVREWKEDSILIRSGCALP
jgi:hypothetical protein